ncbi:RND family efflux transporter MFP subunit [Azospirillum lipoferum]|uniref:Efflux RND transporter periplasmic adaptor subunit n=1 Tax=Azospirillum lipoferum TaxID=193 RepID=A0A5A9FU27_AZOLI|nr:MULTISPECIES: efflux RND transporter periplasmic adaptor subunit [Azospirillum]KAA0585517.1 efflux RND transporter periplasmic adaptor subunit [Azospirillum lipoferum]MCP1615426.1 RND family efflux transporter MFP subunit [Azospirillum lipoferum]MDW5532942.1 efflux RND transporter periplasmic adaptor subunit [Azospirillum sp. NL1]
MNTHPHPAPRHPDPRLSETLASLTLEPVPVPAFPPAGTRLPRPSGGWHLVGVLALIAAIGCAGVLWRAAGPAIWSAPIVAAPIAMGPATAALPPPPIRSVTGSGHVVALREAAVHPRRGGVVTVVHVEVGSAVRAGDVLAELDDPELRFALRDAELARDRARLILAARRLDAEEARDRAGRMADLGTRGAVSTQAARDAATAAAQAANLRDQAAQEVAKAELEVARAAEAVSDLTLRSPLSGIVSARRARIGEAILSQADARAEVPLFTVTDPHLLALDVDIAETALAAIGSGARGAAVLDAYADTRFTVEVARIAPVASAERGTIAVRLTILDPPPGIRPSMAVRVDLPARDPPAHPPPQPSPRPSPPAQDTAP